MEHAWKKSFCFEQQQHLTSETNYLLLCCVYKLHFEVITVHTVHHSTVKKSKELTHEHTNIWSLVTPSKID